MPGPHTAYEAAYDVWKNASDVLRDISAMSRGEQAGFEELDSALRSTVPPGIYRHWKSTKENEKHYAVLGVAGDVDRHGLYFVIYAALYPPYDGLLAARRILGDTGFLTPIDRDIYRGPRFSLIKALTREQVSASFR